MRTPIYDFVTRYAQSDSVRLHMPGHKGKGPLGCEMLDITEIDGADVLYAPSGIIEESEENATALFGTAHTYFSVEGSSLAIKAMLAIACPQGSTVLAARNAHKAFVYACALLDLSVDWLIPDIPSHACAAPLSAEALENALKASSALPSAVYVTSPDYLGNLADIPALSLVCRRYGVPLLVDNAHGAYLAFLSPSLHPIALGATMACDSAHKTLPTLTGGAYLHIAEDAPKEYLSRARAMLSLFASTSPSYLILSSLDLTNRVLANELPKALAFVAQSLAAFKEKMARKGFHFLDGEPLKVVLCAADYGYSGQQIAAHLQANGITAEFADDEYVVLMASAATTEKDLLRLEDALSALKRKPALNLKVPAFSLPTCRLRIREATLAPAKRVKVEDACGCVCAAVTVACPPAVPLLISGEVIGEKELALLRYYKVDYIDVIK